MSQSNTNDSIDFDRSNTPYSRMDECEAEKAYSNRRKLLESSLKKTVKRSSSSTNLTHKIQKKAQIERKFDSKTSQENAISSASRFSVPLSQVSSCAILVSYRIKNEMDRVGRDIQENANRKTIGEIIYDKQVNWKKNIDNKLKQQKFKEETEEMNQCPFEPKFLTKVRPETTETPTSIYDKSKLWRDNADLKKQKALENKIKEELEDCSFKPNFISKQLSLKQFDSTIFERSMRWKENALVQSQRKSKGVLLQNSSKKSPVKITMRQFKEICSPISKDKLEIRYQILDSSIDLISQQIDNSLQASLIDSPSK
ncbi:unnamed protein product [Blepharisma stoltei]|uniref:Uncharacterized protein n=1 Tax=Blepharisma stoltei TaxID=1481888 RepID=A0AAU9IXK2_9CILI|nr:unnamed protein product [Blepharisma stoltei]